MRPPIPDASFFCGRVRGLSMRIAADDRTDEAGPVPDDGETAFFSFFFGGNGLAEIKIRGILLR